MHYFNLFVEMASLTFAYGWLGAYLLTGIALSILFSLTRLHPTLMGFLSYILALAIGFYASPDWWDLIGADGSILLTWIGTPVIALVPLGFHVLVTVCLTRAVKRFYLKRNAHG